MGQASQSLFLKGLSSGQAGSASLQIAKRNSEKDFFPFYANQSQKKGRLLTYQETRTGVQTDASQHSFSHKPSHIVGMCEYRRAQDVLAFLMVAL